MVCVPPWRSIGCRPVPPCWPGSATQTMTVAGNADSDHGRADGQSGRHPRGRQARGRECPPSRFGEADMGRWRTAGRLPLLGSAAARGRPRANSSQGGAARLGRSLVDRERALRRAATEHHAVDVRRVAPGHVALHHIFQDARRLAGKRVAVAAAAVVHRAPARPRFPPSPAPGSRRWAGPSPAAPLTPPRRASAGSAGKLRWWPPACARCPSSRASPARGVSNRAADTPPPRPGEISG